ncbi:MAG: SAM-dependent methyltransferase [Pseudomonadota bacterium]
MSMQASPLPAADDASHAHSDRVAAYLRERIAVANGSISFSEFMHEVMYAPGLGYYAAGLAKFGAAGDFVTAPEISSAFGNVIATQIASIARAKTVLEFGAGTGKLAADVLRTLAALDALPETYLILEVSPELAERQRTFLKEAVPEWIERVHWASSVPEHIDGVVLANEVLDAMPVERFVRHDHVVRSLHVRARGEEFEFVEAAPSTALSDAVTLIEAEQGRLPEGYRSEVCLAARHWIGELAETMRNGLVLLFDYGVSAREYYAADRSGGWLRCHFRHHVHNDPLILPGIQDLSAWVDFTAVAEAAHDAGLDVLGYTSQAQFLIHGGLDRALEEFADLPPSAQLELSTAIKVLTLPGEMGENVKVLALGKHIDSEEFSFGTADRTASL